MKSFALLAALIALSGCAAIEKADQANTERLLAAAGFRVLPANTPQRQQSLESMPPYKVTRKIKGDEVYYFYACPAESLALIGTQEAYSKYRELQFQQNLVDQQTINAETSMAAATQWSDWPVWSGPAALPPPRMGGARR